MSLATPSPHPVLYVVTWFYDYQPGLAIYRQRLELLAEHYELHLLVRNPAHAWRLGFKDAARVHVLPETGGSSLSLVRYCLRVARQLARLPEAPVFLFTSHLSMVALGLRDRPVAIYWNEMPSHYFTRHGKRTAKGWFTAALRRLTYFGARSARVVMPISRFMADDLVARGLPAQRVPVVDMGVSVSDMALGLRAARRPGPLTVCYAGTLTGERGRDQIVGGVLAALVEGIDVKLLLVGVPDVDQVELRAAFGNAGYPRALEMHGLVSTAEVYAAYARADLGVTLLEPNAHFQFNPPTKLFEYLVLGLPVICNRIRTLTHYVEDGRTGFHCDYSSAGVARAITRAAADRAALDAMRAHCIAVGERYRWDRVAPHFLQQIQRLYRVPADRAEIAGPPTVAPLGD
ncbi:glycosyltransferase family 4 protein [Derxia gummosa]|uniref:Glycosyltransferase family 4 protein n=1 Tax=Derxia gummosa DSM 723 TaxID=1121388 RepID=A0A8B6X7Z7_9BURK|nr:glycosyltransferase family 4 protein [Derxia gummosa]